MATATSPSVTSATSIAADPSRWIPQILAAMPTDWRGTTFRNSNLLGRQRFAANLTNLLFNKTKGEAAAAAATVIEITEQELTEAGNAEDYLRVATNLSVTLELALAAKAGIPSDKVFSFGSTTMPVIAVAFTAGNRKVHLYHGSGPAIFDAQQLDTIGLFGATIVQHAGSPLGDSTHASDLVLTLPGITDDLTHVDGIVDANTLLIMSDKIHSDEVLVIRKRMSTPMTTPAVEATLQELGGLPVTANTEVPTESGTAEFLAHMQTLAGTDVNINAPPVIFTAGLPSLASLWTALASRGGADIVMCSTAYGGSNQLADIIHEKISVIKKHTFDIQGINTDIVARIQEKLDELAVNPADLAPTTILFVEIPTNPDMKVPDVNAIASILAKYTKTTNKKIVMLVDATFAPGSKILSQLKEAAPELAAMVFTSLSKSVSRGLTTGGSIVANHTEDAISLILDVAKAAELFDTKAKPDQMLRLVQNHKGVEDRCQQAYVVASEIGLTLQAAVKSATSEDMELAFVNPRHAQLGFTSSTFSFNLPAPKNATDAVTAAFAQRFVDLLTECSAFKPCVSFGQDNGLVYATVPATSTQGAIKEQDKAKQAVGGVQLVRLSFPPSCDTNKIKEVISTAVVDIYASKKLKITIP